MNRLSIEEVIQEAQKEGLFSNLPGKGEPLRLDPSPDAVVNGLLKEANVKPDWVEVAQEIDTLLDDAEKLLAGYATRHATEYSALITKPVTEQRDQPVSRWRSWWRSLLYGQGSSRQINDMEKFHRQWSLTLSRYAVLLHRANTKIRRYNYLVPGLGRQRSFIDVAERLNDFVEQFPLLQQTPAGMVATRGSITASLLTPAAENPPSRLPRDLQAGRILQHVDRSQRRSRCRK